MPDIQKDLVHTVDPGRCGNCKHPKAAHVDGKCLFEASDYKGASYEAILGT